MRTFRERTYALTRMPLMVTTIANSARHRYSGRTESRFIAG
jgi:hypothetical protein